MTSPDAGGAPPQHAQRESLAQAIWRERRASLAIWLRFAGALAVLMLVTIWARPFTDGVLPNWLAVASAAILRLFGMEATATRGMVDSSIGAMSIIRECTAVYPTAIFVAAVVAYPSTWRRRLLGIGLGIVSIQVVNIARLLSLLYIAGRYPDVFEMAHLVVWQSLIVLCTIVFWILWVSELADTSGKQPSPAP